MGGKLYELGYEELSEYLANYEIVRIPVELEPEEEQEYNRNREKYGRRERNRTNAILHEKSKEIVNACISGREALWFHVPCHIFPWRRE